MAFPPYTFRTQGNPLVAPPSGPATAAAQLDANFTATAAKDFSNVSLSVKMALPVSTATTAAISTAINDLATVARTGAYADLTGKPTLGTASTHDTGFFLQTAGNLSDVPSPGTALANLGGQAASAQLTSLAALSYTSGVQVVVLTAANTGGLVTVGAASGNILNKAAGDSLYQPLATNLTAFAGLAGAADKGFYFTGSGALATYDLTAQGRTFLAASTDALQRAALGLGSMATQAASAVAITGGSVTGITDIAVADGGTGVSTLAAHGVVVGAGASAVNVTGAGTLGQVLTSNGPSADPTFQTLSVSPGMVLLATLTASNSAALNFTGITAAYDEYEIHFDHLIVAAADNFGLQFSTNGGSSYDTGANYTRAAFGAGVSTGNSILHINANATTFLGTASPWSGKVSVIGPNQAANKCMVVGVMGALAQTPGPTNGSYEITGAVNAFRIIAASGNLTSGKVRVYGITT